MRDSAGLRSRRISGHSPLSETARDPSTPFALPSVGRTPLRMTFKGLWLLIFILSFLSASAFAQMPPDQLVPDSYVKLFLKDSSEFYVLVLARPVPDRVIVETAYGQLEIPFSRIDYAIDYAYNWVQKGDLKRAALKKYYRCAEQRHHAFFASAKVAGYFYGCNERFRYF